MGNSRVIQNFRGAYGIPAWTLYTKGVLGILVVSGFLAALTASECHYALMSVKPGVSALPSILFGSVMWLWWGAVAAGIWWLAQRAPWVLTFSRKSILIHTIGGSLLCLLHLELVQRTLGIISLVWGLWGEAYSSLNYLNIGRFGLDLAVYGVLYGISGFLHMQSQRQSDALLKLELERQLTQAQLKALQMQMEPHFLFNTLNAITSLMVQGRNKEAIKTMTHLSDILRATLQRKAPEKVPFAEELKVIESYLAIQQVRFAGRLEVKIDATAEAMDGLVPCFLLQPLVENAIQHGIAPRRRGGSIETCVKRVDDKLWMQVKDDGCGADSPSTKGHGIGLQNIRERLAYFYPGSFEFSAMSPASGGYEVTIQIPYESATV